MTVKRPLETRRALGDSGKVLRVLTLSSLFPDAGRGTFGVFVERQTLGLAAHPEVELQVVAPVGMPPWPLSLHPHYRPFAALPARETWQGVTVHRPRFTVLPGTRGRFAPALMAAALLPVLREIQRDFPFDVIDAEYFYPDGPAAARLARRIGVPFSIKARGSDIHVWGKDPRCAAQIVQAGRGAGGLLAVSAALKRDMAALGLPDDRIAVHYTGVDLDRFRPRDRAVEKAKLGVGGPLILTVGYLIERKGQRLVLDAMPSLPGATLLIVGQGPAKVELEARIAALGIGDRVRMMGPLPHDALPALYAAADVVALPSASEGLANVWVESLASGTPIVLADVGGARELVDRAEAGRIVARDPAAIATAIRDLLADPPSARDVRATAAQFTWDANRDRLYDHLEKIVRERAGGE